MSLAKKSIKWLVAAIVVFALILTVSLAVGSGAVANAETEVGVDVYVWVEDSATGLGSYPAFLASSSARTITVYYGYDIPANAASSFSEFAISPVLTVGNSTVRPNNIVLNNNFSAIAALELEGNGEGEYLAATGASSAFYLSLKGANTANSLTCMVNNSADQSKYLFYAEYELPANARGLYTLGFGTKNEFTLSTADGKVYVPAIIDGDEEFNIRAAIERPTAITGLTYNGTEQTGVNVDYSLGYALDNDIDEDYTITGTAAGNYRAVFELIDDESTCWAGVNPLGDCIVDWSISPKDASIAFDAASYGSTYGSAVAVSSSNVAITGLVSGDSLAVGYSVSGVASLSNTTPVGEYTITPTYTENSNYNVSVGASVTYTVSAKAITLSFDKDAYSSVYGAAFETPVIDDSGVVTGDNLNIAISGMPTEQSNVGEYNLSITWDTTNNNYSVTGDSATYTITTKYITIPVADDTAAPYYYTGSEITFAFTSESTVDSAYYTLANNVKTAVGDYTVTATLNDTTNTAWVGGGTTQQEYAFSIEYATIHVTIVGVYGASETTLLENVEVNVGSAIALPSVRWFKTAGAVYDNAMVTTYTAAMDNQTLTAEYTYAIGAGDADGDGIITAGDVIQMKRYFVGLDASKLVEDAADAWSKKGNDAYETAVLQSALDVNDSGTFRTSDIVAVREALATGYSFKIVIENGVQLVKEATVQEVGTYAAFKEKVLAGYPVKLINDITAAEEDFEVALTVPADIDLNGYTLTVNKFIMSNAYAGATLKVANSADTAATIFTVDGIGITAPLGNVIVNDFTGYIYEGSTVTLAAANHSLHIEGDVLFKDYAWENKSKEEAKEDITNLVAAQGDVTANANPTPVEIPVDTHVVVEAAATLTVDQITVIEPMGEDSTANTFSIDVKSGDTDTITVDVSSKVSNEYVVESVNQEGDISKIDLITDGVQEINTSIGVKTEAEFRTALGKSEKVLFGANISITSALEINADVVIDLNGFTLSSNLPTTRPVTVTANTTVTMENGAIYNGNTASYGLVENRGTLTLKNLTVDEYGADGGATFRNHSNATLTVKDCDMSAHGIAANQLLRNQNDSTGNTMLVEDSSFVSDSKTDYPIILRGDGQTTFNRITVAGQMGAIVIEGNTVVITDSAFTDLTGKDYYGLWITNNYSGTNVTVNGGAFDGGKYGLCASVDDDNQDESDVTITINGGTFTGGEGAIALGAKARNNSTHTWTININGGNFVGTDPSEFVAPNSVVTEKDGIYTVEILAARIGEVYYETVQAAINNVKNGETIVLNRNVTDGTGLKTADDNSQHTKAGKTFTIDFNGFTYTVDGAAVGSSNTETQAMHWGEKDTITLKNGTFVVSEAAVTVPNPVTGKVVKMAMQNYANLTIKDMTMDFTNIPLNFYGANEFTEASGYSMYNGLEDPKFCTTYRATAALTIDNSTITLADSSTKGVHIEVPNAVIKDSTINGTVCLSTDGNNASVTITNSTVTKGVVGYFATDVITQNGDTYTVSSNS